MDEMPPRGLKVNDRLYELLSALELSFTRVDHPAVATCSEAEALVPTLPGQRTKNLFLRDDKGKRHFLAVFHAATQVTLSELATALGVKKLSFASPERLRRYLKVEPGAVSLLAILNDEERAVELLIEEKLLGSEAVQCHPWVNTSTLVVPIFGIRQLLSNDGRTFRTLPSAAITASALAPASTGPDPGI